MILLFTNYLAAVASLSCIIPTIPFHYNKKEAFKAFTSKYVEEVTELLYKQMVFAEIGNFVCVFVVQFYASTMIMCE